MEYSFKKNRLIGFFDAGDEFWEALEEGVFRLSRCDQCHQWLWDERNETPPYRCPECGSWDQEWIEVVPKGTIYQWNRTTQPFDGVLERREQVPYVTVVAEIDDAGGAHVTGMLDGSDKGLRVGARVRGTINKPSPEAKGYATVSWTIEP